MKYYGLIGLLLVLGCVKENKNQKKAVNADTMTSKMINTIGPAGSTPTSLVKAASDKIIEFKNDGNGLIVCKYPSNVCRTNADEHSGGASAYGLIPNSADSFIHYMKFRFYSDGYFAKNPEGHIAFGLRGKRMRVEEYGDKAGVDGRGIIIGHIGYGYFYNNNNKACVDRMAQIESYYRSAKEAKKAEFGNKIFPTTCSDTIFEDNKWYSVEIEVTSHQYIIYRVYDASGNIIYKTYYNDQPNYLDPNLTEWFVGHVFESANTKWSVRLEDFEVGHIVNKDVFYPVKDFTPPLNFSTKFGATSASNSNNYSIILDKSSPSQIKLHNINARKKLYGCASWRKTKTGTDSVDCGKAENYREMIFSTETDWDINGDTLSLKESFIQTLPPNFYTIYFRMNPQDQLTQVSLSLELKESQPNSSSSGTFCNTSLKRITNWKCNTSRPDSTWVDVGAGCFHQLTGQSCN